MCQAFPCHLLPLCVRHAIVAVWVNRNTTSRQKLSPYFDISRVHQLNQVIHDNIHAVLMKIAMIRAADSLRDACLKSRIILQIHDELVVEIAPGEAEQATALVRNAMEHAVTMAVPLDASTGIGSDWQLAAH